MEKQNNRIIEIATIAMALLFALNSCETWRSECEGEIIVENPIPDNTLYVGGESYFRDLFAPPVVLKHTADKNIVVVVLAEDGTIVDASRERSQTTGRLNAIKVVPIKEGKSAVTIVSENDCEYFEMNFLVSVKDTTNN